MYRCGKNCKPRWKVFGIWVEPIADAKEIVVFVVMKMSVWNQYILCSHYFCVANSEFNQDKIICNANESAGRERERKKEYM